MISIHYKKTGQNRPIKTDRSDIAALKPTEGRVVGYNASK